MEFVSQIHARVNTSPPPPPRVCPRPLLESIIQCATDSNGIGDGRSDEAHSPLAITSGAGKIDRVVSSSCHDVSILALLYAMKSDLIVSIVCGVYLKPREAKQSLILMQIFHFLLLAFDRKTRTTGLLTAPQ